MNEFQQKLVEMFKWLTEFIHKHNLRYYVVAGTLLGAVRHGGIIPWDDDIDIAMPRKDYDKLIKLMENPIEHYVIETCNGEAKDFVYAFAKFYDTSTTMTEYLRNDVTRGVYIDIFPLDGVGNDYQESVKYYKRIDRANMLLAMKVCTYRKDRKWWKNVAVFLGGFLPINVKKQTQKIDKLCRRRDFDDYNYVVNSMSTYRFKDILTKEIYGKPTPLNFEGFTVYGPERAEEYLEKIYGDWRKLPPLDKRHSAHDFVGVDLTKGYKK